jgi:hypothetical protein
MDTDQAAAPAARIAGRAAAVPLPQRVTGSLAWLPWGVVHVFFLIGFRTAWRC